MAARYVNPQNVAAQGQSFYTGLLPGSYDQGGGGRGNQSNVYGAGSGGGGGGGIPDRTQSDARSITDYKPKLSIDMRSRTGDKFKEWLKGPPEPTLVKLDGEVNPVQQAHAGAVHQAQQVPVQQAHSGAVHQAQQATSGSQALVPVEPSITQKYKNISPQHNPIINPTSRIKTRPTRALNPVPYQSGSKGFAMHSPDNDYTPNPHSAADSLMPQSERVKWAAAGLPNPSNRSGQNPFGGPIQLPFPGMGKPAYTTTTGKPAGRTQTRRPNIPMNQSRPTQQQLF